MTRTDGVAAKSGPGTLRLLQVLESGGGGSGRHFLDLCAGLAARGHHVHAVYSPVRAEEGFVRDLKASGLAAVDSVDMTRSPGLSDLVAHRAISRIIRQAGPFDIIHGHSSKAGALTRLRLPGRHIPRVYTPHAFRTMDPTLGKGGRLIYGAIELLLARFLTDSLICVSEDERRHAVSLGVPPAVLSVVVNGVATPPATGHAEIRARFGIPQAALLFGFVGRLSPQKAPERLVEAFRRIAASVPTAHLLMIGFGELEPDLHAAIEAAGLSGRVHLTASITGAEAMNAFDILVMPSRYEAMSYVMLEAAAAGKPIITTDIGGASTVVTDRDNGRIVPNSDDVSALAAAMAAFADPVQRQKFTDAALVRKNDYGLGTMIERTEALYRRLASKR